MHNNTLLFAFIIIITNDFLNMFNLKEENREYLYLFIHLFNL